MYHLNQIMDQTLVKGCRFFFTDLNEYINLMYQYTKNYLNYTFVYIHIKK